MNDPVDVIPSHLLNQPIWETACMPPSMVTHWLKTGDGQNPQIGPGAECVLLTAALCQKYLGKKTHDRPTAVRHPRSRFSPPSYRDRIRAERTLEVLRRKEQDLCNAALLAEAALAGVIS